MGGFTMMGGMGMNPMMMGGMGMMPGLMPLMIMQQMMQMMQMLMMMMGGQQGGMPGGGMGGGFPGGGCGCGGVGPAMGNGYGFPGAGGGGAPPYMPYGGGCCPGAGGYGGVGGCGPTGPLPFNPSGNRLADLAGSWGNRHFKPGQTHRCADFVSTMIAQSGNAPPGFRHQVSCNELQRYGRPVDQQNLQPGDVVFFGNTYRPGRYTHTGIYLGNGRFAHRPTANKPVQIANLNSPYWSGHFTGGRRLNG